MFYLSLPFLFLLFWFLEAPLILIRFFLSFNKAALHLLSFPLFIQTFFKPLKNEYRQGLIVFSIVAGMIIKTFFLLVDMVILLFFLAIECLIVLLFICWPIAAILWVVKG